jgi:hypothetical protein
LVLHATPLLLLFHIHFRVADELLRLSSRRVT